MRSGECRPAATLPEVHKWLLVLAISATTLIGCSTDGRALAEPDLGQTTTTRPPPPTSAPPNEESETGLVLSSPDFEPGEAPPVDATCAGANRWPGLEWSGVSDLASELAISLTNQTNPEEPLLLWLVAGISPEETGMAPGVLPAGAFETLNDYGNQGWGNPCVESFSDGSADMQFRLHILEQPSGLAPGGAGNEAWDTLNAAATDSASVLMRTEATSAP